MGLCRYDLPGAPRCQHVLVPLPTVVGEGLGRHTQALGPRVRWESHLRDHLRVVLIGGRCVTITAAVRLLLPLLLLFLLLLLL